MSNPIYKMFGSSLNPQMQIVQQFNEFRNGFKGDAQSQVQQILNSGRISQEQYNDAVQKAQLLKMMLNR